MSDPTHVETRLLVVAEMLDRAVAEVRKAMDEIKTGPAARRHPVVPEENGDATQRNP